MPKPLCCVWPKPYNLCSVAVSGVAHLHGRAVALTGLGTVDHKPGRPQEASQHYQQALEIALDIILSDLARVLRTNLGFLAELADDLPAAEIGTLRLLSRLRLDVEICPQKGYAFPI